jgi:hypothetical protein
MRIYRLNEGLIIATANINLLQAKKGQHNSLQIYLCGGRLACEGRSEKETSIEFFLARCCLRLIGNQLRLRYSILIMKLITGLPAIQGDNRSSC